MTESIEDLAKAACLQIGVEYKPVPPDGEFHQTKLLDSNKKGNGRIKLFPDLKGGIAFNWVTGERQRFFTNQSAGLPMTKQDREKIEAEQRKREAERAAKQDKAALKARDLWANAKPALRDHQYLVKKQIKPYGIRQTNWAKSILIDDRWQKVVIKNALLVALYNEAGIIRNVQAIFPTVQPELGRNKDFLAGAELSGLFAWVGDKSDTVCLAEGLATAHTLHEETGFRVYIAFTANNLLAVAKTIRRHLPEAKIIVCADNDKNTTGNPGLSKAIAAAEAVEGLVATPPIAGDFNDYKNHLEDFKP